MDLLAHSLSLSGVEMSPAGRKPSRTLDRFVRNPVSLDDGVETPACMVEQRLAHRFIRFETKLKGDEGVDALAGDRVRLADNGYLRRRGMLYQRAFHLERADQTA